MNVTDEQLDLLRILVGVYNGGCRGEFVLAQSQGGNALIYDERAQPTIEINAAVSDFERLASEDLLDVRYTERGTLRGKPTAKGVRLVASGGMKKSTTERTAHVKPADQRPARRAKGSWSDRKKWGMGIAGTLITAAVIGIIAILWNQLTKGVAPSRADRDT